MKFTKLHIYGFGRFQDYQIEFYENGIHVFLGENEAGKSTIKAFIRAILFGFPTKLQNDLRYEPKLGGPLGGTVSFKTSLFGEVTVERVVGKATGDVKVYFNDGSIGGENELSNILGDIDRTIFNGIYSFGMNDLQTMDQLNSEELNKFMYGVGIAGRHSLLDLEKKTDKSLQNLYKPTGKKPIVNQQLKKVVDLENEVSKWKLKTNRHEQLVFEREQLEKKLKTISDNKKSCNEKHRYYEKLDTITPLIVKKQMYENRLQQLPPYSPFPEDGIIRLEQLQNQLVEIEAEYNRHEQKWSELTKEIANLHVHENLNSLTAEVTEIRETTKLYENKREEKISLTRELEYEQQEYNVLKEKFGSEDLDEKNCETSILAEQQLNQLSDEEDALKKQEQILKAQFGTAKLTLEQKELQVAKLNNDLLDETKRNELEEKLTSRKSLHELQQQLLVLDEIVAQISEQENKVKPSISESKQLVFAVTSLIFLISAVYLAVIGVQQIVSFLLFTVAIVIFLFINKQSRFKKLSNDLLKNKEKHLNKRNEILAKLEVINSEQFEHIEMILTKDEEIRNELSMYKLSLKEALTNYDAICNQLDHWEALHGKLQEKIVTWAQNYDYPSGLHASQYKSLFKLVEQLKDKGRQIDYLLKKRNLIENAIKMIESKVRTVCNSLSMPYDVKDHHLYIEKLTERLNRELEMDRHYKKLAEEINELESALKGLQVKQNYYEDEIVKLLQFANVTTEDEFRQKGKVWKESLEINEQLRITKSQISPFVSNSLELDKIEKDALYYHDTLKEEMNELEVQLNSYFEAEKEALKRLAELNIEMNELEEGKNYSDLLHHFEIERGILNKEVKNWLFYRTVLLLISEAKSVYEKERQPKVILKATQFFSYMTNHEYNQIYAPIGEQRIFVERHDGLKFEPNELSQGTKEQLYLALRWALATVHSKEIGFPIIIDDIFVNFDKKRRLQAIKLLKELSLKHQIVFFTCHPFIASEISTNHYLIQ